MRLFLSSPNRGSVAAGRIGVAGCTTNVSYRYLSTSTGNKVDPTRFQQRPLLVGLDVESIRHFRKVDERYKELEKTWKTDEKNNSFDEILKRFDYKDPLYRTATMPNPMSGEDPEEGEIPPLNLDTSEGFGSAMSYVSDEQTLSPIDEEEEKEDNTVEYPIQELLQVGRHTQITAGGRVYSFSILLLIGTGKGAGGLGYARGNSVGEALLLAKKKALKNLMALDLWNGNNIGAEIKLKYKKNYVFFYPRRPGGGRTCGYEMGVLLDCFGIKDCGMGHGGPRNKHALYRAVFLALRDRTRSPEKVARMLGRKLFNRAGAFYYSNE